MHTLFKNTLALLAGLAFFAASVTSVQAASPVLDSGAALDPNDPYAAAQEISNIFESKGIYGKLEGEVPVDIYKFTASQDGEQTFRLLVRPQERSVESQAFLILVDPTDATEASQIGLDVPSEEYHTAIITPVEEEKFYTETNLFTKYVVAAEQKVRLTNGATYYLVVFDIGRQITHYAITTGEGKAWSAGDVFANFAAWLKVKTDNYAASDPFQMGVAGWGMLIFLIGLLVVGGTWLTHELFSFYARFRPSEQYLERFKSFLPTSRILFWMGLVYTAVGGYIYFAKQGFNGLPFVISVLFVILAIAVLYLTFVLHPQLAKVTGHNREAFSPLLRRWMVAFTAVSGLSLAGIVIFLSMYFA